MSFKLSKKQGIKLELMQKSQMRCIHSRTIGSTAPRNSVDSLRIDISGTLSKIPSVTRGKQLGTKKGFSKKTGEAVVIPTTRTNPEYQIIIEALNELFSRTYPRLPPCFYDTKNRRVFGLILLADSCNLMDSHNLNKFAGDWLQRLGVLNNDKFLDCFAKHKANIARETFEPFDIHSTTIILTLDRFIRPELDSMIQRVNILSESNVSH